MPNYFLKRVKSRTSFQHFLVMFALLGTVESANCDFMSSSPESALHGALAVSTPPAAPSPTPVGNCPTSQKYDFADGRCEECIYSVSNFRETLVSDEDPRNTVGRTSADDHWLDVTFGPDDVVLGTGTPDNSAAFNDIDNFLNNAISSCYQRDPSLYDSSGNLLPDITPSPFHTGWGTQYSQCVTYQAFQRYHLLSVLPDGTWSQATDPSYSFQFRLPQGHRWWFSDITEIWIKNANGDLVRRAQPNGTFFEERGNGMMISYFDSEGNRIDPTTILDPRYTHSEPIDPATDPDLWSHHSPKLRDGIDKNICYSWEVRGIASPISLFMPGCDMRELEPTIVKFPLNPHDGNEYTIWKASKCMPLLVFDPSHSGRITSGKQLVGEWTGGGAPTYDGSTKPWKHGFQMLATLDTDGNGVVSESELDSLSVWSDNNQNGVSEDGEVLSALEFGVKQLRYQAPKNFQHGDIFIESGYKLKLEGSVVDGMLIDWYGKTAPSELALVPHLPFNAVSTQSSPINKYRRQCTNGDLQNFAGGWRWWLDSDPKKSTRGYLTLGKSSEDTLVGTSFSIQTARKKGTKLDLMLGAWPLEAEVMGREATMHVRAAFGSVVSEIKLSSDGKTITGTTRATSGKGSSQVYSWTAERKGCLLQ